MSYPRYFGNACIRGSAWRVHGNHQAREFYEKECISEGWTVDELHRQKESGLFMRLAVSKDKEGVLTLAHEGQQVQTPEDVVKNTYTLEFLGIEERKRYKEKERSTTR